jgi:hypothetical protein
LGLELSNATSSIYWIFVLLFDEAHNPKVVSSNLTPATNWVFANERPDAPSGLFLFAQGYEPARIGLSFSSESRKISCTRGRKSSIQI